MRSSTSTFQFLCFSVLFTACATYAPQYTNKAADHQEVYPEQHQISHRFYLIGDAGYAHMGETSPVLAVLQKELSNESLASSVLFLGDNIYPAGLPKKEHKQRGLAVHRLDNQLEAVKNYKGNTMFIPGNHDWYADGLEGLKREQKYIEKKMDSKEVFFPRNGCPLQRIKINEQVVVIAIDTEWYLTDWDKHPTMNDDCEIKDRAKFFEELEGMIKKNANKTTLIALHHPMFSYGIHGGQFSVKQQLFPAHGNIPIPGLASLVSLVRKTGGVATADLQNARYLELRKRIVMLAQFSENVIFASGHEHTLQYIVEENTPQIVSGSGSIATAARQINGSQFSYGGYGYATLDVLNDGSSWVRFYGIENGEKKLMYTTQVLAPDEKEAVQDFLPITAASQKASIYTQEEITKSKLFRTLWGSRYRKYYGTEIIAPTVRLDTLFGGLIPERKGGGHQSKSLRMKTTEGKQYVMRALRKSAEVYLQALAFQEQYIQGQFEGTHTESLLMDIYTGAHPYAPFVVGGLADAVGVYHTNPKLYYVPKQAALGTYAETFGDALYMIEERAASGHGDIASFGHAATVISTDDLLKKIRKSEKHKLDEVAYIRARLFDMVIGDWDRHIDQWRWAVFEGKDGTTIYRPIPRDRDQVFSIMGDGALMKVATRMIPALRLMEGFDADIRSVKGFNASPYALDVALIKESDPTVWQQQAQYIQEHLTEPVIDAAFLSFPKAVRDETIQEIKTKLISRNAQLQEIAARYYDVINTFAIVKGTDKDDWFEITYPTTHTVAVTGYRIKKGKKGKAFYHKIHDNAVTKELWIYGLDDADYFDIKSRGKSPIKIRLIGGQNKDTYVANGAKNVHIYDFKTKKNNVVAAKGAKVHLTNRYALNTYQPTRLRNTLNQFVPNIGANPDDGLMLGFVNTYTYNGFDQEPFTQRHRFQGGFYFATSGFDIAYRGEFAHLFGNWNFGLTTRFTSPNYSTNFFGYGNTTTNEDHVLGLDYNRVRLRTIKIAPALLWKGHIGASFKASLSYESITVAKTTGRFVNVFLNTQDEKPQDFMSIDGVYEYKNQDNNAFPSLGMTVSLQSGYTLNLQNLDQNFGYIIPSLGFDYKLIPSGKLVLATKCKAHITVGNGFQFFQAASIGASDGLRGYRNQRFTGKSSYYQNTDLRWNVTRVKTNFLPVYMGIYGGFDYGRVWVPSDPSMAWNTSYGGGIFFDGAQLLTAKLAVFVADEGARFSFGLGFGF